MSQWDTIKIAYGKLLLKTDNFPSQEHEPINMHYNSGFCLNALTNFTITIETKRKKKCDGVNFNVGGK